MGFIMIIKPFLAKYAVLFFCLVVIFLFLSPGPLLAAEGNGGISSLSPQQLQQVIQNATPEQIQELLKNTPSKQKISPFETIYVEEPQKDLEAGEADRESFHPFQIVL